MCSCERHMYRSIEEKKSLRHDLEDWLPRQSSMINVVPLSPMRGRVYRQIYSCRAAWLRIKVIPDSRVDIEISGHIRSRSDAVRTATVRTMNNCLRSLTRLAGSDAGWVCSSCAPTTRWLASKPLRPAARNISTTPRPAQEAMPTMEQQRARFKEKNRSTL